MLALLRGTRYLYPKPVGEQEVLPGHSSLLESTIQFVLHLSEQMEVKYPFFGGSPEEELKNISNAYSVLDNLTPLIIENQGTGNLKGLLADNNNSAETNDLSSAVGGALIICADPGEYIISGRNMTFN
jgi:hypothetical protein